MKKIALGILVALIAASPAVAAKKSKKAAPAPASSNEASWRLVKDAFPIALPGWAIPIYLQSQQQAKR